jgi:tetratricopeptide (TPR) repeat protein
MVKQLNELVPFVHQRVPDARKLLSEYSDNNTKIMFLYDTFIHRTFDTDEAAAAYLGQGWSIGTFKSHSKRLHQYLLQLLIFVEPIVSEYDYEVEQGIIKSMKLKILFNNSRYASAFEVALELLEMGFKYECPIWVADASRFLISLFISGFYDKVKDIEVYFGYFTDYNEYAAIEQRSEYLCTKITSQYNRSKGYNKELLNLITEAEQELSQELRPIPSFLYNYNKYRITSTKLQMLGQHEAAYEHLQSCVQYLKTRKYKVSSQLATELINLVSVCKALGKHEEGESLFREALKLLEVGSVNWFGLKQACFLNRMAAGQYDSALQLYNKVTTHKAFTQKLGAEEQEIWHVLGAYLYIAYRLSGQELPKELKLYRSSKYLGEIAKFNAEKDGQNATAIIAHLILLHIEEVEERSKRRGVLERIEALDKYKLRFLPDGVATRSRLFIEIIGKAARDNFNTAALLKQKIDTEVTQLRTLSNHDAAQPFELEVIPYGTLLGWLLQAKLG